MDDFAEISRKLQSYAMIERFLSKESKNVARLSVPKIAHGQWSLSHIRTTSLFSSSNFYTCHVSPNGLYPSLKEELFPFYVILVLGMRYNTLLIIYLICCNLVRNRK